MRLLDIADGTTGTFTPPQTMADARARATPSGTVLTQGRRFAELLRIARKNGILPFRKLDFTTAPAGASTRAVQADGLRRSLEEAGGAFVKLGQLLSTRTDVLPPEFVAALSLLQQSVTPAPWDEVEAMLEREYGAPLGSIFAEFDREPIAAASIGQVHRAVLASGAVVAVKVQRPGIVPDVRRDIAIMLRIAGLISATSAQAREIGIKAIAEQYTADLLRQLDFRLEALNLSAMRTLQARGPRAEELRLPELYPTLSTDRALVMEFLEGDTLSAWNARSTGDARTVSSAAMRTVLRAFLRQIVFDGVYHADLHPGNIMMLPDGQPALVDFGSVGRLDLQLRTTVQELLIAYLQNDTQLIADGLLTLTPIREGADEKEFRRELSLFITFELGPGARVSVDTVDEVVVIFTKYGMTVPPELIAAGRAFAILEGTLRATLPGFDLLEEARALASEQISDQMNPGSVRELLTKEATSLLPMVRRLPRRIDQIGLALEKGNLNVNIRILADRRDRRMLTGLVRRIVLVAIGGVAGITALGYLTAAPAEAAGVISEAAAGVTLAVASAASFVWAGVEALIARRRN